MTTHTRHQRWIEPCAFLPTHPVGQMKTSEPMQFESKKLIVITKIKKV